MGYSYLGVPLSEEMLVVSFGVCKNTAQCRQENVVCFGPLQVGKIPHNLNVVF